ncbi:hypothetical protein [Actinoplanes sp. HUAS TT8]|uniref:hypothetical protein n=1 Tax=Actinoplanes sp. HUAS TT8 TaxID=3447453 RepID=UPI003F52176D
MRPGGVLGDPDAAAVLHDALTDAARGGATEHPVIVESLLEALRTKVVRACDGLRF